MNEKGKRDTDGEFSKKLSEGVSELKGVNAPQALKQKILTRDFSREKKRRIPKGVLIGVPAFVLLFAIVPNLKQNTMKTKTEQIADAGVTQEAITDSEVGELLSHFYLDISLAEELAAAELGSLEEVI